ncbi:MAG: hypothetical protein NC420_05915 [Eubacterium sp.]|nr:hypothetical protein [Eubacterium sp.]MCM1216834.1 hypothetical protein [Lachnospiraceae bacterium]MCM1240606.1 hypothetical protein [Lachnospiraceae bacterium]
MKKKPDKTDILFIIILMVFILACIVPTIIFFIRAIITTIYNMIDFIKMFIEMPLITTLIFGVVILFMRVVFSWHKRDDFFYFVASILSSPSEYFYKKKKKQLLSYRDEIKELIDSVTYFSNIDPENFSKEDFWKFADDISKQNERLERNRRSLEKKDDKINIAVQLFILCCGVITSLLI